MRHGRAIAVAIVWLCALGAGAAEVVPAFPGAVGPAAGTPGGRGGRVIEVTTLADDGPGSLREACMTAGPRTIVFRVGGVIRLRSSLRITEPYVTIAGQTAPGDGILLRDAGLWIETHDVVTRFLRVRIGASDAEPYDRQDALHVGDGTDGVHDVIVDHCSFSWSIDECASVVGGAHDVTLSRCIVSEALREPLDVGKPRSHSMALLLGNTPDRVLVTRCLLAHCDSRNPRIQGGRHAFVNNVVYDWRYLTGTLSRDPEVNFVGNVYLPGGPSRVLPPICDKPGQMGRVWVRDNRSSYPHGTNEWTRTVDAPAADHRADAPFDLPMPPPLPAGETVAAVLADTGATAPRRDRVDRRIVRDVRLRMGTSIDRPEEVGGYPPFAGAPPPEDRDHDGMADAWERAEGLDPADPHDAGGIGPDSEFTHLERYLESLLAPAAAAPPPGAGTAVEPAPWRVERSDPGTAPAIGLPVAGCGDGTWWCRATAAPGATVEIRAEGTVSDLEVVPRWFARDTDCVRGFLRSPIDEPGVRVVRDEEGERELVVVVNPPPIAGGDDATVVPASDDTDNAAAIQAALDASAGATVELAPGRHRCGGEIRVPSSTTLRIPGNAEIVGLPGGGAVVAFDDVADAALVGPGVVRPAPDAATPAIRLRNAAGIRIEDLVVFPGRGDAVRIDGGRAVRLEGVTVPGPASATDDATGAGIAVTGSVDTLLRRVFVRGMSVGIGIHAGRHERTEAVRTHDVTVTGCDTGIALRAGGEDGRIRTVGCADFGIDRAQCGIDARATDGGAIEDVVFRDGGVVQAPAERAGESPSVPVRVAGSANATPGTIERILLDRVRIGSAGVSRFEGVAGLDIWGATWTSGSGTRTPPADAPLVRLRRVSDARILLSTIEAGLATDARRFVDVGEGCGAIEIDDAQASKSTTRTRGNHE